MRVVNAAILAKMCLAGIEDVTTGRARGRVRDASPRFLTGC